MRKAGRKQRQGSGDWEQLTNRQQRRITRLYDEWSAKTRASLRQMALRGETIATQQSFLERSLREFERKMEQVYERGIEIAKNAAAGSRKDRPAIQRLTEQKKEEGNRMIEDNLIPLMSANLTLAIAAGIAVDSRQLRDAFASTRSMAPAYAGGAWVMIFDTQKELGLERETERRLEGLKPERIRWVLDPRAEHCQDSPGYHGCPNMAGEYPNWNALPTVPAGQVTCRGNCRCHLEVFRDGEWRRGVYDD